MNKKLAKIKYLPNNFQIIEPGIMLFVRFRENNRINNLNYWSVDLQEPFIPMSKHTKKEDFKKK